MMIRRNKRKLFIIIFIIGCISLIFLLKELGIKLISMQTNFKSDTDWLEMRKSLHLQQKISKVIILAYARGGSTFCGDIFNIDLQTTIYWFEPLKSIYAHELGLFLSKSEFTPLNRQKLTPIPRELRFVDEITDHLSNLLNCTIDKLPTELLLKISFNKRSPVLTSMNACMKSVHVTRNHRICQEHISSYCGNYEILGTEMNLPNSSLSSTMNCIEILHTIRRWKLPVPITARNPKDLRELLFRFLQENNKTLLMDTVYKPCFESKSTSERLKKQKSSVDNNNGNVSTKLPKGNDGLPNCFHFTEKFNDFLKHYDCMEDLSRKTFHCRKIVDDICDRTDLVAAKVWRPLLADLEPLIQKMPDIHVVHYVRDPRAVINSRREGGFHAFFGNNTWTVSGETRALCTKMRYDLEASKRLQHLYPGSVMTVRYEDLVQDPRKMVTRMYDYFGHKVPVGLDAWIRDTITAPEDQGPYLVKRKNGTKHISEWKSNINEDDADMMNYYCQDIIQEFAYDIM